MKYFSLTRRVPIAYETEVLVLGGGPSGVSAAICAAREGAEVMLVERYGFLGGQATGGLVIVLCGYNDDKGQIIKGYCQEIIDYLHNMKSSRPWFRFFIFEPEVLKRLFDNHIVENKVKLLFNSYAVASTVEDNKINKVIIESKSGIQAIEADIVIDCTGDGDCLKWCKENFEQKSKEEAMHVTACFRIGGINTKKALNFINKKRYEYFEIFDKFGSYINPTHWVTYVEESIGWFDISHVNNINITNTEDLTQAELETRNLTWRLFDTFKSEVPGFENAYLIDIAPLLGVRDSRRLKGKYVLTKNDFNKTFEDGICYFPYYTTMPEIGRLHVPYRVMLPKKIKNLLVAGRSIGIEHELIDCMREIAQCFATGQAAGVAAAIAVKDNKDVAEIDVNKLKQRLVTQGAFI
ncbi:MAG: FAD-dependent oxidoreductase [Cyanobacteriota bacterium]